MLRYVILLTGLSLPAFAGNLDNFASCTKGNDCKSQQCFQKRCEPSTIWNGHGKNGSYCESNSNCESRNCERRSCAPKPEAKKAPEKRDAPRDEKTSSPSESSRRPTSTRSTGGSDDDDVVVQRPQQAPIAMNACAKELRATLYSDDSDGMFARDNDQLSADICARYDAKTIATARALMEAEYGVGFTDTLREIENKSDKEIACGKKAWDARPVDARDVPFKIPVSCSGQSKAEVERCVGELGSVKVTAAQARMLCSTYEADTLRKARQLVASGYKGNFPTLCRNVDHRSDEEIACAKRSLDKLFQDDTDAYEFQVVEECAEPLVKR